MIHAESLSRYYGDVPAVRALSFDVRRGEVMGLLGPNGAGKSTTMKMLTCFLPPSSGTASIDGVPISDSLAVRARVGYLPENAPSYPELAVRDHLRFLGRMHGLGGGELADRIRRMSERCGLDPVLDRRIDELSKGYRQRVGLAGAMLHDPEVLILDEPTTGLDPNQVVEIRSLIRELGRQKTVLLSSHVLSEVEAVCDRIMIIDGGELKAIGTPEELAAAEAGGRLVRVRVAGDVEAFENALKKRVPGVEILRRDEGVDGEPAKEAGEPLLVRAEHERLAAEAFSAAVEAGVVLTELTLEATRLEDVFRRITGGGR